MHKWFIPSILLTLLLFCSSSSYSQNITSIKFNGLKKTKEHYLRVFMVSKEGMPFDSLVFKKDVQVIKNLNLFFEIEGTHKKVGNDYALQIDVREATTVYPEIDLSIIPDNFLLMLGIGEFNWRGEGKSIGGYYQWYDRHSFSFYQETERHIGKKTGHAFSLDKYSTVEPLYFRNTTAEFDFDSYALALSGYYNLSYRSVLELGAVMIYEEYTKRDTSFMELPVGSDFTYAKNLFRAGYYYENVNYNYERQQGIENNLYVEDVITYGGGWNFISFNNETVYYALIGRDGNFAARQSIGIATNNLSPLAPYVFDSYVNIRGIGNRVARGTAKYVLNTEYRHTFWRHKWFILQAVAFADLGSLRYPGEGFNQLFDADNMRTYAGLGGRLYSRQIYNTVFRFDYGINTKNTDEGGFVFGIGHFF
jgi:outer membrane protein insertion porin family